MTKNEGQKVLSQLFGDRLSKYGFTGTQGLSFVRESENAQEIITFGGRVDKEGVYYFTFGVGVRFQQIERTLASDPEQRYFPTIGTPIHLLRDTRSYTEWSIAEGIDAAGVRDAVMFDIERLALPFLKEFSSLERVREKLESEFPKDWFTLDGEQRVAVLAAIDVAGEQKMQALERIERALDQLQDKPAKKRKMLERLRERLSQ